MSNMVNVNEEWATLCKTVASLFHQQSFFSFKWLLEKKMCRTETAYGDEPP